MWFFRYVVSVESGNILIWNRLTENVIFKQEECVVKQLLLDSNSMKFIIVSKPSSSGIGEKTTLASLVMRTIPGILKVQI